MEDKAWLQMSCPLFDPETGIEQGIKLDDQIKAECLQVELTLEPGGRN